MHWWARLSLILLFVKSKACNTIGITGLTLFLFWLSFVPNTKLRIVLPNFYNGAVASSRLEMKAHKHKGGTNRMLIMVDHNFIDAFVVIKYKR
jgi:hypothetical protein